MSAAAAPTVAAPSAESDPIDDLDLSEFGAEAGADLSAASVPEAMQLGGARPPAEAPPSPAPAPDANAPVAITRPEDGATWREKAGRWYLNGKIVAGERPAGAAAAKPGDLAPASAPKVEAPDPAVVDDPGAAEAPVPFRYRAMQETHELKDATLDPKTGDLLVKAASVGQVRQALNALHAREVEVIPTFDRLQKENATLKADLERATSGQGEKEAHAGQLMEQLQKLFQMPDEDAAAKLFFKMRDDFPRLQIEARANYWEQQARQGKGPGAPATAPKTPPETPAAESLRATPEMALDATRSFIEDQKVDNLTLRDLTADDWQQYNALLSKTPYAFARPATAEDAKLHQGLRPGEDVFDKTLALEHLTAFATNRRAARATAASSARVAAQNARTTQPQIDAPPVPGADRVKTPASGAAGQINSREDWEKYMDSPDL